MSLEELESMSLEIEEEIKICERDLKKTGSLVIKTQSFTRLISKEDPNLERIKVLKKKAIEYQNKAKELSERRTREKKELEQEMEDSKIRAKRISEIKEDGAEPTFYKEQSSRLDDIISTSMDSLESLRRQGVLIDRINNNLRQGAMRLGVSHETISMIESRFAGDKSLFWILFCGFIALIFILRLFF